MSLAWGWRGPYLGCHTNLALKGLLFLLLGRQGLAPACWPGHLLDDLDDRLNSLEARVHTPRCYGLQPPPLGPRDERRTVWHVYISIVRLEATLLLCRCVFAAGIGRINAHRATHRTAAPCWSLWHKAFHTLAAVVHRLDLGAVGALLPALQPSGPSFTSLQGELDSVCQKPTLV